MKKFFIAIVCFSLLLISGSSFVFAKSFEEIKGDLINFKDCGTVGHACCDPKILTDIELKIKPDLGNGTVNKVLQAVADSTINKLLGASAFMIKSFAPQVQNIIGNGCADGEPTIETSNSQNNVVTSCVCKAKAGFDLKTQCGFIKNESERNACNACFSQADEKDRGVWTAIGCVNTDIGSFIQRWVLGFGIGLAGIVAFGSIIYAAIQMQMSQGNAEQIKKAQELLTSSIIGLLFIIFSVFILQFIGVNILQIPGFGS